jgi:hypothetical protein
MCGNGFKTGKVTILQKTKKTLQVRKMEQNVYAVVEAGTERLTEDVYPIAEMTSPISAIAVWDFAWYWRKKVETRRKKKRRKLSSIIKEY